ncbi:hypothetical protein IM816_08270 [Luteibacter flocculans]|uniref:Ig-like domain-containing protein n=1 Tax=Luteibacter flocculans TaxID=2780091 RepID=A0ABY4T582_9GAMM|nr:hypothetical protein [Luteibacter flocculans]URL60063.1 hypothetical protein IM816_08270 [Luteibacter flocculans]
MPQDRTPDAVLPDPLVFASDVLAPVPEGMAPDHLLLAQVRNIEIPLTVSCPKSAINKDVLQLLVDDTNVGDEILLDPYLDGIVPVSLPASVRSEGPHAINYKVIYRSGGHGEDFGPPGQQFIADYTAPGGALLPSLLFDDEVIADGVTPDKLSVAPGGGQYLASMVAPYFQQAWGDQIQALLDENPVGTPLEVPQDVGPRLQLPFPLAALEAAGDGDHRFSYRVTDRAGNESAPSMAVVLSVRLSDAIPDLLPPVVPGAADGLVTDSDARIHGGVTVEIPANAAIQTGDTIVWSWNARLSPPIPVTQNGQDPLLTVTAPYADVYDDWLSGSGDNNRTVLALVGYTVFRDDNDIGSPAQLTRAPVNLSTPGGKDPDPATPVHESIQPPSVQSAAGGPVNVIPADAIDEDATAIIPGMTAGTPSAPAFLPGDSVQLFWDGVAVDAPFIVTTAGDDVQRTVPKEVLTTYGPGTWMVRYVATRKLAMPPFENAARSPDQAVQILDVADIPGGGDPLRAAKWLEGPAGVGIPDQIDYEKAVSDGGTPLRVYAYDNIKVGDTLHMVFQGYDKTTPGVDPIDGSRLELTHTVTAADLVPRQDDSVSPPEMARFIDVTIPTETLLLIPFGSATFDYAATNDAGSAPATQAWIYVATRQ